MPSAAPPTKLTLRNLLEWLLYCGAYFSVVGNYALIFLPQPPTPAVFTSLGVSWLLLLVCYIRARVPSAMLVHVAPVVTIMGVTSLLADFEFWMWLSAATIWFAAILSFPVSLMRSVEYGVMRHAPRTTYVIVCAVGGMALVGVLWSFFPSLLRGTLHAPSLVYGCLLGVWVGLYHSLEQTPDLRSCRIRGLSARGMVGAGLLGTLMGSAVLWLLSSTISLPIRYAPFYLGVPAAACVGLFTRRLD